MKIMILGGTGMIGSALAHQALVHGHEVIVLTRHPSGRKPDPGITYKGWDGRSPESWLEALEQCDALVNLVGENIGESRWTLERKQAIRESRLMTGRTVVSTIQMASHRPKVLIQASAVGYYGPCGDEIKDENSPAGEDFLGRLCVDWENSTRDVESLGVRRVVIRTGLVLDRNGGAMTRLLLQNRLFAGGSLGNGRQWWPWIHLKDEVRAILFLLENEQAEGAYNLTAPNPVQMKTFGKTLAKVMRRPYWLPVPAFALRLVLGEMSKIVLEGQRAVPRKLLESGFSFDFPDLEPALRDILIS